MPRPMRGPIRFVRVTGNEAAAEDSDLETKACIHGGAGARMVHRVCSAVPDDRVLSLQLCHNCNASSLSDFEMEEIHVYMWTRQD